MKSRFVNAFYLLVLFSASMAAQPVQPPETQPKRQERNDADEAIRYLNMSSDQKEKLRQLRNTRDKETTPLRLQESERNAELRLLWLQLHPDPARVKLKLHQIQELKWQILEKDVDHWLAFRNILTEEQLARFLTLAGDRILKQESPPPPPREVQNEGNPGRPRQP
jgi:Spy/CpxP family protein refolding chaperone